MEQKIRIALVYGSTREKRLGEKIMKWAFSFISKRDEFQLEIIDPRDYGFSHPGSLSRRKDVSELKEHIKQADAYIVVTPEYNHGYPAPLKELIDSAYFEWNAKPAAFISYGGFSGGIRAVEQLRQVFAELHVVTIRDGVAFPNAWEQFDDNGNLRAPERAEAALNGMLLQLKWWANALRHARQVAPYQEAIE